MRIWAPESSESGGGFGLNEADEDAVVDVLDAKADHAVAILAESHLSQTSLYLCLFHANRARRGGHRPSLTHRAPWISGHGRSGGLKVWRGKLTNKLRDNEINISF